MLMQLLGRTSFHRGWEPHFVPPMLGHGHSKGMDGSFFGQHMLGRVILPHRRYLTQFVTTLVGANVSQGLGATFSFHISGANVFSLKMGWAHFVNAAVRAHVISQRRGATLCCTTCWAKWLLFSFCEAGCDPFGYQFFVSTKSCILRPLVVMGFA